MVKDQVFLELFVVLVCFDLICHSKLLHFDRVALPVHETVSFPKQLFSLHQKLQEHCEDPLAKRHWRVVL